MNPMIHPWHFNWPMILLSIVLILIYFRINGYYTRRGIYFMAGIFLLLAISVTPLDPIGHHFLFSAHMIQHIVILLIIPPLLLNGFEKAAAEKVNVPGWMKNLFSFLFHPVVAWVIGMGAMWFWHIPGVFLSMKMSPAMHFLHLFSLLLAGLIFIWPVHGPVRWKKLSSPLLSVLYLFMACVGCTLLGIILTFSTHLFYVQAFIYDITAANTFLPAAFQMTPATDQQVAGLIMWVPACVIYIINSMVILGRWLKSPEPDFNE